MNVERQNQDTLYQMEFDFDTPSGEVRPHGSGEGANPTAAPTREQQAFAAWREELNWEERILENIAHRYNLEHACRRVKSNKGAPGIDGMTVEELERWLNTHMAELREQLLNGSYRPQEVKGVSIPKPNGGRRQLGIPTAIDRLVQQAFVQELTPILDPQMSESSYGFRPNRSAHQALKAGSAYVEQGYKVAVDFEGGFVVGKGGGEGLGGDLPSVLGELLCKLVEEGVAAGEGGVASGRVRGFRGR